MYFVCILQNSIAISLVFVIVKKYIRMKSIAIVIAILFATNSGICRPIHCLQILYVNESSFGQC